MTIDDMANIMEANQGDAETHPCRRCGEIAENPPKCVFNGETCYLCCACRGLMIRDQRAFWDGMKWRTPGSLPD